MDSKRRLIAALYNDFFGEVVGTAQAIGELRNEDREQVAHQKSIGLDQSGHRLGAGQPSMSVL